ncbi:hypothetical protein [Paenibacillus sp. FSL F4-0100]
MSIGGLEASPSSAFCSPWDPQLSWALGTVYIKRQAAKVDSL